MHDEPAGWGVTLISLRRGSALLHVMSSQVPSSGLRSFFEESAAMY